MEVSDLNYSLISSPYDNFMRQHLEHYGYFCGRSEIAKKYGFCPRKSQISTSSGDSDSSCSDDENDKSKNKSGAGDLRSGVRQGRNLYGLTFRGPFNDESSFEPRWPIEIEVLREYRIKHIDAMPSQPELFYKPTTDYAPFIRSFDENNGRTVFNYDPETCGYFTRSRIGGNRQGCRQANVTLQNSEDKTLIFESRFESGNLMKAVQVSEFEYELYLRYDLYTKRNTQWFYFRMQNIRKNRRYRFTIVNFFKPTSLYSNGMMPLMYSVLDAENKGIGWRRWGEEIVYARNNLYAPNSSSYMYSLTWTCTFPNDDDTCFFAHCYPYTYSDLQDYLNEIQSDRYKSQFCKQKILCRTLAENYIYLLTITTPPTITKTNGSTPAAENQVKKGVVITARVHPGETNASWMMKGLLDFLLGDSADAQLLRDNFIFKIIPMLNPDGVIVGNYRCSLSGRDLNRNYKTVLKAAYPSIWHTREMIKRFRNETDIVLYCDFHGHSRKQNVFVYGCENKNLPNSRMKERIFPAMIAKNDPSKFSFPYCKFKVQKQKEGTGRVVMWSLGILNSYTLEATFCGSTQREKAGHHFNTKDLESIGYHFLDSLLDYCDPDETKRNRILSEILNDFRRTVQIKLLSQGVNPAALGDIDLDQFSSDDESSDDGGSESSADDGLPKHLEAITLAKVRAKQLRKKTATKKSAKDTKRKEDIDKENLEKNKTIGLSLSKGRNGQFPSINDLENQQQQLKRDGGDRKYRVCKCIACLKAQAEQAESALNNDLNKSNRAISGRRPSEATTEPTRNDNSNGANSRANRWPTLTTTQISNGRTNTADEKSRRPQANFNRIIRELTPDDREKQQQLSDDDNQLSSAYFQIPSPIRENPREEEYTLVEPSFLSCQQNDLTTLTPANDNRDAFTATYLLRRLNVLERESTISNIYGSSAVQTTVTAPNLRLGDDSNAQTTIELDNETDIYRSGTTNVVEDERPSTTSFVTNRISAHLNERLLGIPRPPTRPKSTSTIVPNRTILDIKSIQPTMQLPNQRRVVEQQQHQRQRVMMVFGKQGSSETPERQLNTSIRSFHVSINERKQDDYSPSQENSPSTVSKMLPIQPENIPINILARYDSSAINKPLAVRASSVKKSVK